MATTLLSLTLVFALFVCSVHALPTTLGRRQDTSTLSTDQIASYKPYTWYAAAAHCPAATTGNWSCGTNCEANPAFQPVASGGDGNLVQFWYVGWDPSLETVIVAHQGTNTSLILPILTDLDLNLDDLNSTLFPNLPSEIQTHNGFQEAQERSASDILSAVQLTISQFNATNVTVVGHSLGAAIALLDSVYLPLHITTTGISFHTITYGMPRVGNQAFADYVDANITSVTHINNREDPVPILPPRLLGYHHPQGEIHINDDGSWDSCPGQDNTNQLCIAGDVTVFDIFDDHEADHSGPYDGVELTC